MDYDTTQDDRLLAMLSYVLGLFTWIIGPLIMYLVKKDQSRFVAFHAAQATAIQLAVTALAFAAGMVSMILGALGPLALLSLPVIFVAWAAGVAALVFTIVGAIKSYGGEWYKVPVLGDYVRRTVNV